MPDPKPGWFTRNWKWFVPAGCLTGVLLVAALVGALMFGVFSMMKSSDVYTQAVAQARAHPAVVEALGTPIAEGLFVGGNLQTAGPSGTAELSIPLSGPKGKGTLYLEAERSAALWHFSLLVLEAPDGTRVDLLQATGDDTDENDKDLPFEPAPDFEEPQVEPATGDAPDP